MITWTARNMAQANYQGWRISQWGFIRPLRDNSAMFQHDSKLYDSVLARARQGDKLCTKAIAYITFQRLTENDFKI